VVLPVANGEQTLKSYPHFEPLKISCVTYVGCRTPQLKETMTGDLLASKPPLHHLVQWEQWLEFQMKGPK